MKNLSASFFLEFLVQELYWDHCVITVHEAHAKSFKYSIPKPVRQPSYHTVLATEYFNRKRLDWPCSKAAAHCQAVCTRASSTATISGSLAYQFLTTVWKHQGYSLTLMLAISFECTTNITMDHRYTDLEQIASKTSLACVNQHQVAVKEVYSLLADHQGFDVDRQRQGGGWVTYFDTPYQPPYLILPTPTSGQHLL